MGERREARLLKIPRDFIFPILKQCGYNALRSAAILNKEWFDVVKENRFKFGKTVRQL